MTLDGTLVVIDTCVLLRPRLADVLMDLRAEKLFSAHWTDDIDSEFVRNLRLVHGVEEPLVLRRLAAMKARCPEWQLALSAADFRAVPPQVDRKDRHVAAAALALRRYSDGDVDTCLDPDVPRDVILLTDNERDMAKSQMAALGVRVLRPGAFLNELDSAAPQAVQRAVARAQQDLKRPPYTLAELLHVLHQAGARAMVARLEAAWGITRQAKPRLPRKGGSR
ncbi:MAG: hypothetical protein LCI02_15560 [Proteobacteria bacterium]|nr:hypothetical protein [Pseudomonadota bacterium]